MKLRKFTKKGLKHFTDHYLGVIDINKSPDSFDSERYHSDEFSMVINEKIDLPEGPFNTRYELGTAVSDALGSYMKNDTDIEMWSWLAVYYFDIIKKNAAGIYKLGALATVVLDLSSRRKYRHKIFAPAYFVYAYGDSSSAILSPHPNVHGQIFEDITGRKNLISVAFLSIMKKLLWDEQRNDWKNRAKDHRYAKGAGKYGILLLQLAVNNFIIDCETDESIDALIEKFPEYQRP